MKRFFLAILTAASLFSMTGCGNLSPRQNERIDNQNGKIGQIENMQNSMKAEIGKLQNQSEIQNSRLDRVQQGLLNYQKSEDNSGVQIFSGSGGIVVALVGFVGIFVVMLYYRKLAGDHAKTASLLAERIVSYNDPALTDAVFQAALHTNVQDKVLSLVKKHQRNFAAARQQ
jgi:predicted PurR-regulated permease PerM